MIITGTCIDIDRYSYSMITCIWKKYVVIFLVIVLCFAAHHIETEAAPEGQGEYVRGKNYYCGILCYRIPG